MDEDIRKAFDELMARMNSQHERLIDRINSLARDFQNKKRFLIEDALTLGRSRISSVGIANSRVGRCRNSSSKNTERNSSDKAFPLPP